MTTTGLPHQVTTPEGFAQFTEDHDTALVSIADADTVVLIWQNEDSEWYGIRPIHEDDGPYADLPPSSRATLAVPLYLGAPGEYEDPDTLPFPFTVPWTPEHGDEVGEGVHHAVDMLHAMVESITDATHTASATDVATAARTIREADRLTRAGWPLGDDTTREVITATTTLLAAVDALGEWRSGSTAGVLRMLQAERERDEARARLAAVLTECDQLDDPTVRRAVTLSDVQQRIRCAAAAPTTGTHAGPGAIGSALASPEQDRPRPPSS